MFHHEKIPIFSPRMTINSVLNTLCIKYNLVIESFSLLHEDTLLSWSLKALSDFDWNWTKEDKELSKIVGLNLTHSGAFANIRVYAEDLNPRDGNTASTIVASDNIGV